MTDTTARRSIHRLSADLANQIAAGEVIERPASVVKELLENSIDAGARQIDVELERGGVALIRIRDDGFGIPPDELPLAIAPHATSKLYDLTELVAIRSLGFRGEALASIASVSSLTLTSASGGGGQGHQLLPGSQLVKPAAHPRGTTIEMRDLFYNIPARRKFLRAERTEFLHVEEVVKRVALGNFAVGVTLKHNGRELLRLKPAEAPALQQQRIATLMGRRFQQSALSLEFEAAGMRLTGWIGPADEGRSQADLQYFYLNGRIIRDRLVNHALRAAYGERIEVGRFPAWLLFLEMAAESVDINVHPTKHEVRFHETRMVHDFLNRALVQVLGNESTPSSPSPSIKVGDYPLPRWSSGERLERIAEGGRDPAGHYRPSTLAKTSALPLGGEGRLGQPLTIVDGQLIISRSRTGLVVIDRLAALRQCAYLTLARGIAAGAVRSRPLLIPVSLTLTREACERLEAQQSRLHQLGLSLERLAEATLVVREIPVAIDGVEFTALLNGLLPELEMAEEGRLIKAMAEALTLEDESLHMSGEEMAALLRQLEQGATDGVAFNGHLLWRELGVDELNALLNAGETLLSCHGKEGR